jgi:hypothetical protein
MALLVESAAEGPLTVAGGLAIPGRTLEGSGEEGELRC